MSRPPLLTRWRSYLTAEVDGASLAVFRFCFGVLMVWEVLRYFHHGRIAAYYIKPRFFFSYLPFIEPWSGPGMYIHFALLGLLAALIAVGLCYRAAAALFCPAFTYVFLLDKSQYLNHFYLICLLGFLLALLPAHRAFSLDRRLFFPSHPATVPRYGLLILRLQIALVYFFGGIAKLNADWLRGEPIGTWLADRTDIAVIGPHLAHSHAGLVFAYGGLLTDLAAGFLLMSRRTLPLGAALVVFFNVLNGVLFNIGVFPYLMIASLALFPDPAWPRLLGQRLHAFARKGLRRPALVAQGSGAAVDAQPRDRGRLARAGQGALIVLLHVHLFIQLALPWRHWLYEGDVNWTEAGHRFSWRMKLRDKEVELGMYLVDPTTGERDLVDIEQWLTDRQIIKMAGTPDMLRQFAHFLADRQHAATGVRPVIRAEAFTSVNGGPYGYLLSPELDLASEPIGLFDPPW